MKKKGEVSVCEIPETADFTRMYRIAFRLRHKDLRMKGKQVPHMKNNAKAHMKNKTVAQMKSVATIPNSATGSDVTRSANDLQEQVRLPRLRTVRATWKSRWARRRRLAASRIRTNHRDDKSRLHKTTPVPFLWTTLLCNTLEQQKGGKYA